MSLPPQPPSSEEPEKKPVLHSSAETPEQTAPAPESQLNETEKQPLLSTTDEVPTEHAPMPEAQEDTIPPDDAEAPTQVWTNPATPDDAEAPTQVWTHAATSDEAEAPTQSWSDAEPPKWTDEPAPEWTDASAPGEESGLSAEGEEDLNAAQVVPAYSQQGRPGIFIGRGMLIAAASILVVAILLVALFFFLNIPKDPPTDWIASTTPTANTASNTGKILYYLHWTNQNGELKGQLQLAGNNNGTPESVTYQTTSLYNKDSHIIYVIVTLSGQETALSGKINDSDDTLTLNPVGATDTANQIVFHQGSASDYKQQTQQLNAKK